MTTFLLICLSLSALILTVATAMERGAIRNRINGANGLVWLVAIIVSGAITVPAVIVAGWAWGLLAAVYVLAGSVLWHVLAVKLTMGSIQGLIDRVVAEDERRGLNRRPK